LDVRHHHRVPERSRRATALVIGLALLALAVLASGDELTVYSGKRHLTLKAGDLEHYRGERGRRGNKLPRGFQKVDSVAVVRKS